MNTAFFGLSTSLVSFVLVLLVAATVAAVMWSVQVITEERRSPAGRGLDRAGRGSDS